MKQIWKIQLEEVGAQTVEMPTLSRILCVQEQQGKLTVWFECNPNYPRGKRLFQVYGTGHDMKGNSGAYIGTVQMPDGLVWHVYDQGQL